LTREESIYSKSIHLGTLVKGLEKMKLNVSSMSIDKYNHAYFSSNYINPDKKGTNRICIMEGDYSASGIKNINQMPLGDVNSYSVMHPAINWEGTLLVFSSDMPNGKGGFDLYYISRADSLHMWSPIKTFNNCVNTLGAEVFPTITRDGYLYFSSDAQQGLGGLDIYKILLSDAIKGVGQIEHVSYPINSSADDFGWTQDSTGTTGFFSSDRYKDNDNIFHFNYKHPKRIIKYAIGGYVKEKVSFVPLEGSKVFMYNIDDNSVSVAKTDKNGKYQFVIRPNSKVIIKVVDKSHTSDCLSEIIDVEKQIKDTILKASRDLTLGKLTVGSVWKLNNIRYDFNKANIRSDATPALDSLVAFLKMSPINVELGSHTDSRGSFAYNERLSQHRADSAVAYIVKKGISPTRISAKGYGESRLLNKCMDGVKCSEAEHQVNRRTEVKVTALVAPQSTNNNLDFEKLEVGTTVDRSVFPNDFFDECH
jgi:peptidoglycan-associated lipoprotein